MRQKLLVIFLSFLCLGFVTGEAIKGYEADKLHASSEWIKANTIQLVSSFGMCSAVEVQTGEGVLTLTAKHCHKIMLGSQILGIDADGHAHVLSFVRESKNKDLMLLTGIPVPGITIAKEEWIPEHIRAFGYAGGKPLDTEKEGNLLSHRFVGNLGFSFILASAGCIPGDSGGPVVNDQGELVGIINAIDMLGFSYFTPLQDIQDFLR